MPPTSIGTGLFVLNVPGLGSTAGLEAAFGAFGALKGVSVREQAGGGAICGTVFYVHASSAAAALAASEAEGIRVEGALLQVAAHRATQGGRGRGSGGGGVKGGGGGRAFGGVGGKGRGGKATGRGKGK